MSRFMRGGESRGGAQLQRRLERERMGEEAYGKMIAHHEDRPFKIFGVVFILAFVAIIFGVAWMEP
jgi:hypothetical protein